jgi:hypothetical protein
LLTDAFSSLRCAAHAARQNANVRGHMTRAASWELW